jgi:hypothetical protein
MNLFGEDMVIGDFRLSEHGLILASFDDESETEDDLGMNYDTVEEYLFRKMAVKQQLTDEIINDIDSNVMNKLSIDELISAIQYGSYDNE